MATATLSGRMCSMAVAQGLPVAGLVLLSYPLHPPGRPDTLRIAHLPDVRQPQLFVEGTNDPFIDPHQQFLDAVATCQDAEIIWVEGGGHSFEIKGRKRGAAEIGAEVATLVITLSLPYLVAARRRDFV